MSIQKDYLTDKKICRVKFSLPPDPDNTSKKVCVVGDFNNWDQAGKGDPCIRATGGRLVVNGCEFMAGGKRALALRRETRRDA